MNKFEYLPKEIIKSTELTPAERLTEMMLFDYYFDIDNAGNYKNNRNIVLKTVAIAWDINESTFKEHIHYIFLLQIFGSVSYSC